MPPNIFWSETLRDLTGRMEFAEKRFKVRPGRRRDPYKLAQRGFVEISDTGIGIEPQALSTVFDAFTQGSEEIARQFGGLGLGLAISKATIVAHGGTLRAEREGVAKGTTFILELPCKFVTAARVAETDYQYECLHL